MKRLLLVAVTVVGITLPAVSILRAFAEPPAAVEVETQTVAPCTAPTGCCQAREDTACEQSTCGTMTVTATVGECDRMNILSACTLDRGARCQIAAAYLKLARCETSEQTSEAKQELRSTLDTYFEKGMQRRESELEAVKKEVAELEKHIAKRRAAKDELIDHQLKAFVYDIDGLNFFDHKEECVDVWWSEEMNIERVEARPVIHEARTWELIPQEDHE